MLKKILASIIACNCLVAKAQILSNKNLFQFDSTSVPRWATFENPTAAKGKAAMENNGAKGHPSDEIKAGETKVLMHAKGSGIINRMWITIDDRSPEMLRSLKLEMFWDDDAKPAVSVPFGDFFGIGLGKTATFHNALFASPEGRSFICYIPMPFKKAARIQITNESNKRLTHIFYDIDFQETSTWNTDNLYFHAYWHRDTATQLEKDFELLPKVKGKGRFLGVNVGVIANSIYENHWWGEGEVKMYLDGDKNFPTLAGTGTEDYIGTGWGQGEFFNDYAGSLYANKNDDNGWCFYRYHIPDPVFFKTDCKVALPEMGSNKKELVAALQAKNIPLVPATIDDQQGYPKPLYTPGKTTNLKDTTLPEGYVMFYRSDDVSATAYFYLDKAGDELPALQPLQIRTYKLQKEK
ncbi:MAG: glycoside hydrolase family 172 protein [Ginsengibacter sp.]